MSPHLWGIFRERQHSPGREFDDTEILRLVAKHIEAAGYQVSLKGPDELGEAGDPGAVLMADPLPSLVFLMCERLEALRVLGPLEMRGIPHVNPLEAILNTYRDRMITLLTASGTPIPESQVISCNPSERDRSPIERWADLFPIWVKRADVHSTQTGDVEFIRSSEELQDRLVALNARGIARAVLQRHVPGDLIKFYGVGGPDRENRQERWFRWFYHRDQELNRYPFPEEALQAMTQRAALALSLEVYGGDAIVTPRGEIFLIDINAWPSFALFREEAASRIATWLLHRVRRGALQ